MLRDSPASSDSFFGGFDPGLGGGPPPFLSFSSVATSARHRVARARTCIALARHWPASQPRSIRSHDLFQRRTILSVAGLLEFPRAPDGRTLWLEQDRDSHIYLRFYKCATRR